MSAVVPPGSVVGVLGTGQLGRMFAIAARRMGYRVHAFSPDADTPTGQVADVEVDAAYDDLDAVRAFARAVQVVTFEFENVPAATVAAVESIVPVRPSGAVLHVTQNRLREKTFLAGAGIPVTRFAAVRSAADLAPALAAVGCPAILKTASFGYDGKGQLRVETPADAEPAWTRLGRTEAILEAVVDFRAELSIVAARGVDGTIVDWGPIENAHRDHILDVSVAPAAVSPRAVREAREIAGAILQALDVVGVLCVELFLRHDDALLVNELAPRPHNSGHLTVDAAVTSQFEQQLRAVCGLPLGATRLLAPAAAMANLLGELWQGGEPAWARACAFPDVKLHLYGKTAPRPGRKMGHLTALAADGVEARRLALAARTALADRAR